MHGPLLVPGLALAATILAAPAVAQPDALLTGVLELAAASPRTGSAPAGAVRLGAARLRATLVDWDRRLEAARAQVDREAPEAPAERAARMRLELGRAFAVRGRTADALRELDSAGALVPTSSTVQLWRALTLDAAGRRSEAAQAFVSAWTLDAGSLVTAYYVAQRATAAAPADRARARAALVDRYATLDVNVPPAGATPFPMLAAIPDTVARAPLVGDAATAAAFSLLASGRLDDAVAALERPAPVSANDIGPRDRFARAQRHEAENRVAEARRDYEAAVAGAVAGRSPIWVAIGRLADVDGDGMAATDAFEQAVRLAPNDPQMHRQLADAYASQSRHDEALAELMAALLVAPRDAHAHAAVGSVLLDSGRPAAAVTALARALELMPARFQTRYTLARALDALGRPEEAARERARFEQARLENLAQRRRVMATDVDKEEAASREPPPRGGAK
jgi:tetratricopeptide (TPR) repeat protein